MRVVILISSVLVCLLVAGSSTYTQRKAPDLIIVNATAKIYTVDSKVLDRLLLGGALRREMQKVMTPVRLTAMALNR